MTGIFLGVMVPLIVMSVMSGFQQQIREKILAVDSHLVILPSLEKTIFLEEGLMKRLEKIPGVRSVIPMVEAQGLVEFLGEYKPVMIRGISASAFAQDEDFRRIYKVTAGTNDLSRRYFINVGEGFGGQYGVDIKRRLKIIVAKNSSEMQLKPKVITCMVTGIFKTGFYEYDSGMIYASMQTLQKAFNMQEEVTKISLKLKDEWQTEAVTEAIQEAFPARFAVISWKQLNANLFKALVTEKVIMWLIMLLILVVAVFNVMSGQIILVLDKRREIGILKTMGMPPRRVAMVFLLEGFITTSIGCFFGVMAGLFIATHITESLAFLESIVNGVREGGVFAASLFVDDLSNPKPFAFFPGDVYYLDAIPAHVTGMQVGTIIAVAMVLSLLAGLLPAWRATQLRPMEVFKSE